MGKVGDDPHLAADAALALELSHKTHTHAHTQPLRLFVVRSLGILNRLILWI